MEFQQFIRRPFTVEAIEITAENIEEVAALVGKLQMKGDTPFIVLDRRIVPSVNKAYVGWWMTRLGDNYRCYSPKVFTAQFVEYMEVASFNFYTNEENPGQDLEGEMDTRYQEGMEV